MLKRLCCLGGSVLFPLAILLMWKGQFKEFNTAYQTGSPRVVAGSNTIVIDAVHYDGYELYDADEAVALRNIGEASVSLAGWRISDDRNKDSERLPAIVIEPGKVIWITSKPESFARQFGFAAEVAMTTWPGFANNGDEVILFDPENTVVDALVYNDGDTTISDWRGPAVLPYTVSNLFGREGQILYRKREQVDGIPVVDTNTAADWAQDRSDPTNGRKVRYPGWNLDEFFYTTRVTKTALLTVSIAPDNALDTVVKAIDGSKETLYAESLTFENLIIGEALEAAAGRGVEVIILLEGSPPGGLPPQEKYICQRLEKAGGQCWFMVSDDNERIYDRYRYLHSKYILIDHRLVAIGTENLSPNSMPYDDKTDGTWGRRGVMLWTDASEIVDQVQRLFQDDLDYTSHEDIQRWQADHPVYGAPPAGFVPVTETGGITYTVQYSRPSKFRNDFFFELQTSPENSLRNEDGLLGLINEADVGDSVWAQQLTERPHWGTSSSDRINDPNPRLEAYIAAARRGADVRLLLDEYFDDADSPISNHATCLFLNDLATIEKLKLTCNLANPSGLGIHNKMVLAHIDGKGYVHVGSINGSELSHKGNREVALLVQADGAYELLAGMFVRDTPHLVYLPFIPSDYRGPANHVLVSEILYDSYGQDEGEFIELVNPTAAAIDIGGYSLADAAEREDFEDLRRFPLATTIAAGQMMVVATSGEYFWNEYGFWPDFEILETNPIVPNLIDDPSWGDSGTFLRLGNSGDEIILRDRNDLIVDLVTYGSSTFMDQVACPLVEGTNHSLERNPYWRDNDNCPKDFRDWPFPSPGQKP